MFRALMHKMITSFEAKYDYDAAYMHDINEVSASATVRLMMLSGMTSFQGPDKSVWGGAALAATLHGDCGPCAQLIIDRLLSEGLAANELTACIRHDWPSAAGAGLGFRFAQAVLNNDQEVEALRVEIRNGYGEGVLVAASFAAVSYPVYPLLKRALGSAVSCQSLVIGDYQDVKIGARQ